MKLAEDIQITDKMIKQAENRGACGFALAWLRAEPRTVRGLINERPDYFAWAFHQLPWMRKKLAAFAQELAEKSHVAIGLPELYSKRQYNELASTNWYRIPKKGYVKLSRANMARRLREDPRTGIYCFEFLSEAQRHSVALEFPHYVKEARLWRLCSKRTKLAVRKHLGEI